MARSPTDREKFGVGRVSDGGNYRRRIQKRDEGTNPPPTGVQQFFARKNTASY